MDIAVQTMKKEGFFALYKGESLTHVVEVIYEAYLGMLSPLLGIAGVNSLLFASYGVSKRIVSPFGQLTLGQTAVAGAMAGAANAILASPGALFFSFATAALDSRPPSFASRDVQGPHAGPVRGRQRQAPARRCWRDVGGVGVSQGSHARVLGACAC